MFYPVPMEDVKFGGDYRFRCEDEVHEVEFAIREVINGTRDLIRYDVVAKIEGSDLVIYIPEKYDDPKYTQLNINTIEANENEEE